MPKIEPMYRNILLDFIIFEKNYWKPIQIFQIKYHCTMNLHFKGQYKSFKKF